MRRHFRSLLCLLSVTVGIGCPFAAEITQSVNPATAVVGGTVTWTLSAMAGPGTVGGLYASGTVWGGTWFDQVSGDHSWGVTDGALWYSPGTCTTESKFPQYINAGVSVGDAEFYYETLIPGIACQPYEDSVLLFRNVSCNRIFSVHLDHFLGMDSCPAFSTSRLYYDKLTPLTPEGVCTPGTTFGSLQTGVAFATIDCVVKNTWYSMRVRACGATLLAKTWQVGGAEPSAWQLSAVDNDLVAFSSGDFGFMANGGQTAFRNMTVSSIASQGVTLFDTVPGCLSSVMVVGSPSKGLHTLVGNDLTWNIGWMSACEAPAILTLSSVVNDCAVGSQVVNTAFDMVAGSGSATLQIVGTATSTSTPSPTWTFTRTFTPTPTLTSVWTYTFSPTPTRTDTPTSTPTPSPSWTDTFTRTPTFTLSDTPTVTWTTTPWGGPSATWTSTATATPTSTVTWTSTPSSTPSTTMTWTPTASVMGVATATPDRWSVRDGKETFVYPSPVRGPFAHVAYRMKGPGKVHVRVWNAAAEKVAEVVEYKPQGPQTSILTVRDYAPGVYIYRVFIHYDSGGESKTSTERFVVRH